MKQALKLLISLSFIFLLADITAQEKDDFKAEEHQEEFDASSSKCQGCPHASACFEAQETKAPLRGFLWPIPLLLAGFALSYFGKIRYKYLLWLALAIGLIYLSQHVLQEPYQIRQENKSISHSKSDESLNDDEFASFEETNNEDEFAPFEEAASEDEFAPFEEESSTNDEFAAFEEESKDEFQTFNEQEEALNPGLSDKERSLLHYVIPILIITILAGFLSRYRRTRKLRLLFLLGSMVYMGFYNGGCPCMISSFQDFVMWLFGAEVFWGTMLWFLGLMVITYFFGRVWCGWFCHLGALQEFIHKAKIIKPLNTTGAQKFFILLRNITMVVLVVQIAISRTNIFIHYDPFKVAFNLFSTNTTGYVLLFIMLISSLLINRPFCRGFCPVGLAMGWVMRIPGASLLVPDNSCISCKTCHKACDNGAITREGKVGYINNAECIRCGDCQDDCPKSSIKDKFSKGDISFVCLSDELK